MLESTQSETAESEVFFVFQIFFTEEKSLGGRLEAK